MNRYTRITDAQFGGTSLPLVMSIKVTRQFTPLPASGDSERYSTSVQPGPATVAAEMRMRGSDVAETLQLGQSGTLCFTVGGARQGLKGRKVTLQGAVLHAAELSYDQTAIACAVLRFVCAAPSGNIEPAGAEDAT